MIRCNTCGFEGSLLPEHNQKACPSCLMSNLTYLEDSEDNSAGTRYSVDGDGSADIEGMITFKSKRGAIHFIIGLMETYDIDKKELEY